MIFYCLFLVTSQAFVLSEGIGTIMQKLSSLSTEKINKSMLDSPDHCESSVYPRIKASSQEPQTEESFPTKEWEEPEIEDAKLLRGLGSYKTSLDTPSLSSDNIGPALPSEGGCNKGGAPDLLCGHGMLFPDQRLESSKRPGRHDVFDSGECLNEGHKDSRSYGNAFLVENPLEGRLLALSREKELLYQIRELKKKVDMYHNLLHTDKDTKKYIKEGPKEYDWTPKKKQVVIPGKARKIKVVKIIPRPVDDDGHPWNPKDVCGINKACYKM